MRHKTCEALGSRPCCGCDDVLLACHNKCQQLFGFNLPMFTTIVAFAGVLARLWAVGLVVAAGIHG